MSPVNFKEIKTISYEKAAYMAFIKRMTNANIILVLNTFDKTLLYLEFIFIFS